MLEAYTYDANGNRGGRTYAGDDRMTGTHVYDAAGFLVSRGADTFTYTDRGHLKTATVGGVKVDYEYDASDRLAARVAGGVRTEFLYGAPGSPFRVTASRVGNELTQYFYDNTGLLVALERGGARYYVGTDQVNTPRVITDANGAVVKTFATNAYGVRNTAAETGTFELPLGFAGGIEDPVTGLVRFGLRDYEPATGRFTAKDPILHEGGMNLFVYAGNNPVAQRDPSGMDEIDPRCSRSRPLAERIVGHFNKFVEWVKSEDGRDTIENIAEIPAEDTCRQERRDARQGPERPSTSPRTRWRSTRPSGRTSRCPSRRWRGSSAASGSPTTCSRSRSRHRRSSKRRWTRCCRTRARCATRAPALRRGPRQLEEIGMGRENRR